jgi:hypothetical protein
MRTAWDLLPLEIRLINIKGAVSFCTVSSVRMLFILFSDDYVWAAVKCEAGIATWLYHRDAQWRLVRCKILHD